MWESLNPELPVFLRGGRIMLGMTRKSFKAVFYLIQKFVTKVGTLKLVPVKSALNISDGF
jgi:hypothetical protein